MSKHEIRLRRQKLMGHGSERFRNYGAVLQQHEETKKIRRLFRAFAYFLIALALIVLLVIIVRVEKKAEKKTNKAKEVSLMITQAIPTDILT